MEQTDIIHIPKTDLITKVSELCDFIKLTYGIKDADNEFIKYFANTLRKYFGYLTFEKLKLAFEYNSLGYLNEYLPVRGSVIDNSIKTFNIKDMMKVVRAFVALKKLSPDEKQRFSKSEVSQSEKDKIHNSWCDFMNLKMEEYKKNVIPLISASLYTAKFLAEKGFIDPAEIDYREKISIGKKNTKNQRLIFKAFDKMIEQNIDFQTFKINVNELPY